MIVSDWIMLLSAIIVTVGWFVTGHLERKNGITKERRSYRLDMLHSFYPIIFFIQEKKYKISTDQEVKELEILLTKARPKFLLYGYDDEITAYEHVIAAFLSENNEVRTQRLNALADIVRKRIRKELDLPSHTLEKLTSSLVRTP